MNENMGQIIRRLRKERNLTQEELAGQLNVTNQAVSKWENGDCMPDITQIVPLSNVFGVTTDVLFGKDGTDGEEEVEKFIAEMEIKLSNRPDGVSRFEYALKCCTEIQEILKKYPNNYHLLTYSIGDIVCLISFYLWEEELKDKAEERKEWENECVRQANVILSHCTDTKYLNEAHKWMVQLYRKMDNTEKAEEHARKLFMFDPSTEGGKYLALVYDDIGRREDSIKQRAENIFNALDYLSFELDMIGHTYKDLDKFEEAYACYRLYPDIYDLMVGNREDEMPYYLNPSYYCCANMCMKLGHHEEAMDWLEKWVKYERTIKKNWNVITESNLPYFYGRETYYWAESYTTAEKITPILAWKIFDLIRETDRFKAILADAEAFEKGE